MPYEDDEILSNSHTVRVSYRFKNYPEFFDRLCWIRTDIRHQLLRKFSSQRSEVRFEVGVVHMFDDFNAPEEY